MTEQTPLGDQIVDFNGEPMAIKDIPDPVIRTMLGYGHVGHNRRPVITVEGRTWESTPDVCTFGDGPWEWITEDGQPGDTKSWPERGIQYLVCPKCGLDGT
jgi:hypothetical protein